MDSFWEFVALLFWGMVFVAYLLVIFHILGDLTRDSKLSGWIKAIWVVALIFLPFLTALVYFVARGQGMAERQHREIEDMRNLQAEYVRTAAASSASSGASAGASPAEQIASAKALLDSGAITQEEFEALKARALA